MQITVYVPLWIRYAECALRVTRPVLRSCGKATKNGMKSFQSAWPIKFPRGWPTHKVRSDAREGMMMMMMMMMMMVRRRGRGRGRRRRRRKRKRRRRRRRRRNDDDQWWVCCVLVILITCPLLAFWILLFSASCASCCAFRSCDSLFWPPKSSSSLSATIRKFLNASSQASSRMRPGIIMSQIRRHNGTNKARTSQQREQRWNDLRKKVMKQCESCSWDSFFATAASSSRVMFSCNYLTDIWLTCIASGRLFFQFVSWIVGKDPSAHARKKSGKETSGVSSKEVLEHEK